MYFNLAIFEIQCIATCGTPCEIYVCSMHGNDSMNAFIYGFISLFFLAAYLECFQEQGSAKLEAMNSHMQLHEEVYHMNFIRMIFTTSAKNQNAYLTEPH